MIMTVDGLLECIAFPFKMKGRHPPLADAWYSIFLPPFGPHGVVCRCTHSARLELNMQMISCSSVLCCSSLQWQVPALESEVVPALPSSNDVCTKLPGGLSVYVPGIGVDNLGRDLLPSDGITRGLSEVCFNFLALL